MNIYLKVFRLGGWWALAAALVAGLLAVASTTQAHHAAAAEYDLRRSFPMEGTATRVEWINPHSQLYVTVKDENGEEATWQLTTVAVTALRQSGERTEDLIKIGTTYKLEVYPSRTSPVRGLLDSITLEDGRVLRLSTN